MGGGKSRVRLMGVYARRLSGLRYKLVCHLKLAVDIVGGDVREFVYDADGPAFLKGELVEFAVDRYW